MLTVAAISCSEWGGGGGGRIGHLHLATLLVSESWGGGEAPKCTDIKKKSYTCNLYARASEASERLRNI